MNLRDLINKFLEVSNIVNAQFPLINEVCL